MIKKLRGFFVTLGVLLALFIPVILIFLRRRPPGGADVVEDARGTLEQVREVVAEVVQDQGDRKERAKAAREKLEKILSGTLVLTLCFVVFLGPLASLAMATPTTATGQPYIPESYDELVEYYLAAVEVAQEYQALYEEAEAEVTRLLGQVGILETEVERLAGYIERHCRPEWGLSGGLAVTGEGAWWNLGVARRQGAWSWEAGVVGSVGGGNSFGVSGGVTWWLR